MLFELTILGCNSAIPAYDRHPTAQILNVYENLYLIDCGEGTQMQMTKYNIRRTRINQIFISHLHGDHVFGLIGLLTSLSLAGRKEVLDIFAPAGLEEMIRIQLNHTGGLLNYPMDFHVVDTTSHEKIFEDEHLEVYSIPLIHRIPTSGYLFKEKQRPLNLIQDAIEKYNIQFEFIPEIKKGKDYITSSGEVIPNQLLTLAPYKPRTYAYCSDTIYTETIVPIIKEADMLYHETTFCEDRAEQAVITKHSTAKQAATIAQKANVGLMITGHYSSRYLDLYPLLKEAQSVFESTVLGIEGQKYLVKPKRVER